MSKMRTYDETIFAPAHGTGMRYRAMAPFILSIKMPGGAIGHAFIIAASIVV
ncbi:hypothetical protein HUG20_13095 [Salicibibacter cibi]|uniref:Uncharacterized protein n=1 Tax=Salicibibacter cibi TaxID=2743001 RepID=A0A7T6ZC81_9BACI|nr:hypothetical protein [Salicibibacter cibi]QQK80736.1 hypothetical protein HUG20_13095 [Salicibibacter cibi]